jgi:poly(3-hydroxybutyrate) depolymerase
MYKLTHTLYLALSLFLASLSLVQAARSAGCGKSPTLTSTTYTTQINGKSRQYILKLPNNYNQGGVLPYYGLPPFSNNSAIFVVPNGLDSGWANSNGEDITFYDAMVKAVEAGLCVDTSLRFSTGFSYGGAMSYAVACARGKDTRAVAVISGSLLSGCAGGNDPVAYYGQHGTSDSVLPTSGGRSIRDRFVKNNGCTAVAEPAPNGGKSVKTVYKNCKAGYPVTWVIHNGDHNPSQTDSGSSTPFAPANTWEFFSQFASV